MSWFSLVILLALLIPSIFADESLSHVYRDSVTHVRFKTDDRAIGDASENTENHAEHDISGLTSAMKSQQDAGMAAAENVASHEEHDISGLTSAMKSQQDAGMAAAENVASHEEHDISGLTSAMKSQQDAGMAAAEIILEDDRNDGFGVSRAGKQPPACGGASIESSVSLFLISSEAFYCETQLMLAVDSWLFEGGARSCSRICGTGLAGLAELDSLPAWFVCKQC
jgi:hypothetical protein